MSSTWQPGKVQGWVGGQHFRGQAIIIIIIDNRGLIARWCLTPFLLSLPTTAYLGQRGQATEAKSCRPD